MSVFNSLGSNYTAGSSVFLLRAKKNAQNNLKQVLKSRYTSKNIFITYKGREALALILRRSGLPQGSLVAINGYTCYAVYQSIIAAGYEPYYLDIPKDELNFTAAELAAAVKEEPLIKSVIVQNTLGLPSDIVAINKVCQKQKLILIEDLAHSAGMKYANGLEAGRVGVSSALSFSQDKIIDAVTGGAAILNTKEKVERPNYYSASRWHRFKTRLYPWSSLIIRKTFDLWIGRLLLRILRSTRMLPGPMTGAADELHILPDWHCQAAERSIRELESIISHRQKIAAIYRDLLPPEIQFKHLPESIYLRFPIKVEDPRRLIEYIKQFHIYISDIWYDAPIAPIWALKLTNYRHGQCPNSEKISARMVNLPTHLNIDKEEARLIAEKVTEWHKSQ